MKDHGGHTVLNDTRPRFTSPRTREHESYRILLGESAHTDPRMCSSRLGARDLSTCSTHRERCAHVRDRYTAASHRPLCSTRRWDSYEEAQRCVLRGNQTLVLLPVFGKIGPVNHNSSSQVDFFDLVEFIISCIQRFSENKHDFVARKTRSSDRRSR